MSDKEIMLQVLLVEDDKEDLMQLERALPEAFAEHEVDVHLHGCEDFEEALSLTSDPLRRFDMIISDTYRGEIENRDAQVLNMVNQYKGYRFCPLVVYSSGVKPPGLEEGAFLVWADKGIPHDIERAIREILKTNVPQIARRLHDELEGITGSYLWGFLEKHWTQLNDPAGMTAHVMERMIRRRAAIQISDIDAASEDSGVFERIGAEYYVYPALKKNHFNLGDIVQHKRKRDDLRVILTPHCHLFIQPNQTEPKADFILTTKTFPASEVLGEEKLEKTKREKEKDKQDKKLLGWSRSPARTGVTPDGRHWYLPGFLDIPHSYCDFLQVESLAYSVIFKDYETVATLAPPFAEALQSCFASFYASVGVPTVKPESIRTMLDRATPEN